MKVCTPITNFTLKLMPIILPKGYIDERGLMPLIDMHKKIGGWPVVLGDEWDKKDLWNWKCATKELHKLGYSTDYLIDFSVDTDLKNSSRRNIDVSWG